MTNGKDEEFIDIPAEVTPEGEAGDFETTDERRIRLERDHELRVLNAKKGWIGKFTGSTNSSTNNGVFILVFLSIIFLSFGVIEMFKNGQLSETSKSLLALMSAIVGYIFGSYTKNQ